MGIITNSRCKYSNFLRNIIIKPMFYHTLQKVKKQPIHPQNSNIQLAFGMKF